MGSVIVAGVAAGTMMLSPYCAVATIDSQALLAHCMQTPCEVADAVWSGMLHTVT